MQKVNLLEGEISSYFTICHHFEDNSRCKRKHKLHVQNIFYEMGLELVMDVDGQNYVAMMTMQNF